MNFWYGLFPPERGALERDYATPQKRPEELFPLRYRAVVPTRGVKLEGELAGFMHLVQRDRIVVVR